MSDITTAIRQKTRELLESKQVDCVIGYETGPKGRARPIFVYDPADADRLIFDATCVHNLVNYLHDKKKPRKRGEPPPRVAIVAKPCDSRAVNVLLAEQQIARERVYIIGVACEGMESAQGKQPDRCARCQDRIPVIYDVLLGEPPVSQSTNYQSTNYQSTNYQSTNLPSTNYQSTNLPDNYADLARIEALSHSERLAFWLREFDRCIRCYACRQVCPGCYCTTCMFERDDGLWVDAGIEVPQKHVFHLGRALHLAGRCVECNECERVCPMGLPLSLLNRLLAREVEALYGHRAGREATLSPLLYELGEEGSLI